MRFFGAFDTQFIRPVAIQFLGKCIVAEHTPAGMFQGDFLRTSRDVDPDLTLVDLSGEEDLSRLRNIPAKKIKIQTDSNATIIGGEGERR